MYPIQELQERYTVQAADVACSNFFGRLYSPLEVPWTSIDTWTAPTKHKNPYPVEIIDIRLTVAVTAGRGKQGVQLCLGRMKENKTEVVEWLERQNQGPGAGTGFWSPREVIYWPWGFVLKQGACIAGDYIDWYCRYRVVA